MVYDTAWGTAFLHFNADSKGGRGWRGCTRVAGPPRRLALAGAAERQAFASLWDWARQPLPSAAEIKRADPAAPGRAALPAGWLYGSRLN